MNLIFSVALCMGSSCHVFLLLISQGPDVIPIPGTTSIKHLDENLAARDIKLTADDLKEIDRIFRPEQVVGTRYGHMAMTFVGNPKS
jgi:diketogulonate reductase-like aldo/keto reductase